MDLLSISGDAGDCRASASRMSTGIFSLNSLNGLFIFSIVKRGRCVLRLVCLRFFICEKGNVYPGIQGFPKTDVYGEISPYQKSNVYPRIRGYSKRDCDMQRLEKRIKQFVNVYPTIVGLPQR